MFALFSSCMHITYILFSYETAKIEKRKLNKKKNVSFALLLLLLTVSRVNMVCVFEFVFICYREQRYTML